MDMLEFCQFTLDKRKIIRKWVRENLYVDASAFDDLYSRYVLWGCAKEWKDDDTHTVGDAIYAIRRIYERDGRTKEKMNLELAEPSADKGITQEQTFDFIGSASAARMVDWLDRSTDEEFRTRTDLLHLLTERQREVVMAYLKHRGLDGAARELGIHVSNVSEAIIRARATLEAANPDPMPHEWEPHDPNPIWCQPGYRQDTWNWDPDEVDDLKECSFIKYRSEMASAHAKLQRLLGEEEPNKEEIAEVRAYMDALRKNTPFKVKDEYGNLAHDHVWGHKHKCKGRVYNV